MAIPLLTGGGGIVSAANSTTANLAANAVFTGTSEDVSGYAQIMLNIFCSHASAIDGLSFQQSPDGTNWDVLDVYTIPAMTAGQGKTFNVAVVAKFYRLVYANGTTLTTSLRIQTSYALTIRKGATTRPQDARANDNDFEEIVAHLMGFNGTSWDRLRASIANGLIVDVTRLPSIVASTFVSPADTTMQNAATAIGNGVVLSTTSYGTASIQITGVFVGTITFEGTQNGVDYDFLAATKLGASSIASTATGPGIYRLAVANLTNIRARISAYTSGSITAVGRTTNAPFGTKFVQLVPSTNVFGALVANQTVNIALINGIVPLMGNGVTGTGSARYTLASDNSAIPLWGHGATAAAVPANTTFVGLRAATVNPTNATGGNLVGAMADKAGRTVITPVQIRELIGVQYTALAATTESTFVTAGGAGVFNDITQLIITTAGAAAGTLTIKDATTGTIRMVINYPNAAVAPGAPLVINFNPPLPQAIANANWTITNSLATATNVTAIFAKNL